MFGNLTVTGPVASGYAAIYPPGVRPQASSLNYATGQTVANAAFVGLGSVLGAWALRLFTTADAWFVLDVTGAVTSGAVQAPLKQTAATRAAGARGAVIRKARTALSRIAR